MRLSDITQPLLSRTALREGRVAFNDGRLVVIQNPTRTEVMNLIEQSHEKELRGLLDGSNLFVWDAFLATHWDTISAMSHLGNLEDAYRLELYRDRVVYDFVLMDQVGFEPEDDDDEGIAEVQAVSDEHQAKIASHPMLKRIYGADLRVDVKWY